VSLYYTTHPTPLTRKAALLMRRTILLLATMTLTLMMASGVALAVNKIGTSGPDTLRGTNGADNLSLAKALTTSSTPLLVGTTS
jgi:hypothetical protein